MEIAGLGPNTIFIKILMIKSVTRQTNSKRGQSGFSLIELIVALAVFVVVVVTANGIFSLSIVSHRKISSQQETLETGRFLLESISKEVRFSRIYNSDGASLQLSVRNQDGEDITYTFDNGNKQISKIVGGGTVVLNDPNMAVAGQFMVSRSGTAIAHPLVTIIMQVADKRGKTELNSVVSLQTSISPRTAY